MMIVRVKRADGPMAKRRYLALRRLKDGSWEPIKSRLLSALGAKRVCIADLLERSTNIVTRYLMAMDTVREGLRDVARAANHHDHIRIHGQRCEVDSDGAVVVPEGAEYHLTIDINGSDGCRMHRMIFATAVDGDGREITVHTAVGWTSAEMLEIAAMILREICQGAFIEPKWTLKGVDMVEANR